MTRTRTAETPRAGAGAGAGAGRPAAEAAAPGRRVASIDALRGFDMFWIIGGSQVARAALKHAEHPWLVALDRQFEHVDWEGFTFYDLIFPLFLFLIGAAIPFAFAARIARGESWARLHGHLVARVLVLVVLGMMVNGELLSYDPARFQLSYSVLQMLALGYLVASVLYLNLGTRGQVVATAAMLVGYWLLMAYVPVPGHEPGVFRPGANLGDYLNDRILGELQGHWRFGWILGILGHASTAMLGVFAGTILRSPRPERAKVAALAGLGLACLAVALVWSGWVARWLPGFAPFGRSWADWPVWFPIIKDRWTSTFALYAGGYSFLLLAAFYLVIDVGRYRRWATFFVVIGSNSIFAYMCWQLGGHVFREAGAIFLGGLRPYLDPAVYEPLHRAGGLATLWLLLWYLHRNRTFIRV